MKSILTGVLLTASVAGFSLELKSPDAPFVKKDADAVSAKPSFSANGISCGAKTLLWAQDYNNIKFLDKEQLVFGIRARTSPSFPGWAPFTRFQTTVDPRTRTVTRVCGYKPTKESSAEFRQSIRLRSDDKVEIVTAFNAGKEKPELKEEKFDIFFPLHAIQDSALEITEEGKAPRTVHLPSKEKWGDGTKNYWIHSGWFPKVRKIVFFPDSPTRRFVLEFPENTLEHIVLFRSKEGLNIHPVFIEIGKPFSMFLDFGKSAAADQKDCVVNEINFSRNNDYEVSVFDEKKNMFLNPSFESGSRYFHNHNGGFDVQNMIDSKDAKSGKFCLNLKGALKTFNFPTRANREYTLSFYAKSPDGSPRTISVGTDSYFWGNKPILKTFHIKGREWVRCEFSFQWQNRAIAFNFSGTNVLLDDLQFEENGKSSPYYGNKIGIELKTASPERSYVNRGNPIDAKLVVRGPVGTKGKIRADIVDFFNRKRFEAELSFRIPAGGETVLPLAPDSVFVQGVNRIRLRIEPEGLPAYTDFLRISKFKYADNTSPNKNLHAVPGVGWAGASQLKIPDSIFLMMKHCGIGAFSYGNLYASYQGTFSEELSKAICERYRKFGFDTWTSLTHSISTKNGFRPAINGEELAWEGIPFEEMETYPPEFLKKVESLSRDTAKKYPWIRLWNIWTEPGPGFKSLAKHRMDEYAKLVLSIFRGLKQGNPDIRFSPFGTCNMEEDGRKFRGEFFRAANKIEPNTRFQLIDAHPYRAFPEQADTEDDFLTMISSLKDVGYDDIPVYWFEGAYFYPLIVAPWQGIAPWQGVGQKDGYFSQHVPSYDLGWGERVATAMLMRHWLVAYKYQNRIKMACTWVPRFLDGSNPFALFVMSAVMTDMLGTSQFKHDIRFSPDARAYVFEDAKKRGVAAIWMFTEELDRGVETARSMTLDLNAVSPEFIDLMGNLCKVPAKNGVYTLPLSNYPFYIRVKPGETEALAKALNQAKTSLNGKLPVEFSAVPVSLNNVVVKAMNPLSREMKLELSVNDSAFHSETLAPRASKIFHAKLKQTVAFDKINDISIPVRIKEGGILSKTDFALSVLPLKYVSGKIDWNQIPAVPLTHIHMEFGSVQNKVKWGGPQDLSAVWKAAWNEQNLYLRFEVEDDKFVLNMTNKNPSFWYNNDSIQIFFDTLGNGRENARRGKLGFDRDDSSYELLPVTEKKCVVYRRHVPDHQLTGGVENGLKGDMIEPGISCDFQWTGKTRVYTVVFPSRYLMPMILSPGNVPGIGIKIYDRDEIAGDAKQNLSNIPEAAGDAFKRPDLYTQLLFIK